ncbi:ABC transporter substrate-binding protein [Desulfovibrio inopinatus]|uniref:ABC transporter substrate-binding protein n=1 Tax=Desulfovibrio inopinatus TaxID=102109 RepID=UPI000486C1C0|nr:ABC transporter substrate-binding protein [Desulfovibrio inopinatus]
MWIRWYLLLLVLLTLSVPGCSQSPESVERPALRVGWVYWPGWYPAVIAKEKGFFAKHGVKVELVLYNTYTDIFSDFAAGKLDATYAGFYELLKINIPDMKIVMATDYSDGAEGLVVTPDIRVPTDLKGKRVGIQGGLSGSEFLIVTMLRRYGVPRSALTLVDVGPEIVLETMPERIQAGYTWEPYLSSSCDRGYRVLFSTADMPGMILDVFAVQGSVVAQRKADVQAYVDAWFEAQQYWLDHQEEGNALIAEAIGLDQQSISLSGCHILTYDDNETVFTKESPLSLYNVGEKLISFIIGLGDATSVPALDQVIDPEFIDVVQALHNPCLRRLKTMYMAEEAKAQKQHLLLTPVPQKNSPPCRSGVWASLWHLLLLCLAIIILCPWSF